MNMSYCRWQNTLMALRECAQDLEEATTDFTSRPLGRDEREARADVLRLAAQMLQQIGLDVDENDVEGAISEIGAEAVPSGG